MQTVEDLNRGFRGEDFHGSRNPRVIMHQVPGAVYTRRRDRGGEYRVRGASILFEFTVTGGTVLHQFQAAETGGGDMWRGVHRPDSAQQKRINR